MAASIEFQALLDAQSKIHMTGAHSKDVAVQIVEDEHGSAGKKGQIYAKRKERLGRQTTVTNYKITPKGKAYDVAVSEAGFKAFHKLCRNAQDAVMALYDNPLDLRP